MEQKEKLRMILNKSTILCKIVNNLKILKENHGYSNDKMEEVIREIHLPFKQHMFIVTNFSELIKFEFNFI